MLTPSASLQFFVLGAQKCATTWLYQCLRAHPAIHVSAHKNESLYVGGPGFEAMGWERFIEEVGPVPAGCCAGDVSVNYLSDPCSPEALARYAPQARFIIILRHPVDRLVSAYDWYYRKGQLDATLQEVVQDILSDSDSLEELSHDLLERGCYGAQVARYLEHFPAKQFLILNQEVELKDPAQAFRRILSFLQVASDEVPAITLTHPKRNSGNAFLISLERRWPDSRYVSEALNRMHQCLGRYQKEARASRLSAKERAALTALYRPDVERLLASLRGLPAAQVSSIASFESWLTV